jgi:hypothetical protein
MSEREIKSTNIAELQKQFSRPIPEKLVSEGEKRQYLQRLSNLQSTFIIKPIEQLEEKDNEFGIVQEKEKHKGLTKDLVDLTSILKNQVTNINEHTNSDSKVSVLPTAC